METGAATSKNSRGPSAQERTPAGELDRVLAAAAAAWDWHGLDCEVATEPAGRSDAVVGTVGLPSLRRVEVVVADSAETADIAWQTLRDWPLAESWRLCAVVPLAAMGRAHEVLRDMRCELQPWWRMGDGSIAFGGVERA